MAIFSTILAAAGSAKGQFRFGLDGHVVACSACYLGVVLRSANITGTSQQAARPRLLGWRR